MHWASILFKYSIEHFNICFIYLPVCLQALFETIETWIQLSDFTDSIQSASSVWT